MPRAHTRHTREEPNEIEWTAALTCHVTAYYQAKDVGGAEKMCNTINAFFTEMITVIERYGGDVIKFSGDALTVVFPVLPPGGIGQQTSGLYFFSGGWVGIYPS